MQCREIPSEDWTEFCDDFSREHAGWPVTIELLDPSAGPQRLADRLPLMGISLDTDGTRASTLQISTGQGVQATVSHAVELPLHIRTAQEETGDGTLQIEPAKGPSTLVHYHRPGDQ